MAQTARRRVRVLVVDDDPDGRTVLEQILQAEGAVVTAVGSAAEADETLTIPPAAGARLRYRNAAEDGLSFIRRVRADRSSEIASVPAVAVTAYAFNHNR